jgi:hypothetical protein
MICLLCLSRQGRHIRKVSGSESDSSSRGPTLAPNRLQSLLGSRDARPIMSEYVSTLPASQCEMLGTHTIRIKAFGTVGKSSRLHADICGSCSGPLLCGQPLPSAQRYHLRLYSDTATAAYGRHRVRKIRARAFHLGMTLRRGTGSEVIVH